MASAFELEQYEAGKAAHDLAFEQSIADQEEHVAETLEQARTALVTGLVSLGEAAGIMPNKLAEMAEELELTADTVVSGIYRAAVTEVQKREVAGRDADKAESKAKIDVEVRRREAFLAAASRSRNIPRITGRVRVERYRGQNG